jgi:hypothetical protein
MRTGGVGRNTWAFRCRVTRNKSLQPLQDTSLQDWIPRLSNLTQNVKRQHHLVTFSSNLFQIMLTCLAISQWHQ